MILSRIRLPILPSIITFVPSNRKIFSTKLLLCSMETSNFRSSIDLTPFPVVYQPESLILHSVFKKYGFDLRIAGGAVRDILLGIIPHDIDFATNATPDEMKEIFLKENVRTINRNGEAHGTVTARICDKENFEITTLRIDTEPDGRHSKVIFTKDWKLDASRRDLTVNSMFISLDWDSIPEHLMQNALVSNAVNCSSDRTDDSDCSEPYTKLGNAKIFGHIWDYFDGRSDLEKRCIRFVGDPAARIKEDYLRILRFFRFHGRLVNRSEFSQHDYETLKAIATNVQGLDRIAGERCWMELKQILLYPSTPLLLQQMHSVGLFPYLGLPNDPNFDRIHTLWKQDVLSRSPNSATCLAALLSSVEEIESLNSRLRLSNFEVGILMYIVQKREKYANLDPEQEFAYCIRELILSSEAPEKVKPLITEMLRYLVRDIAQIDRWSQWQPPKFPVNGHDLMQKWNLPQKMMRSVILALRTQWVDSDFQLNSEELLTEANRIHVLSEISSGNFVESKPKRKRRS